MDIKLKAQESLSEKEFNRLSRFIYDQCGIKMPYAKKTLLETRLKKRLRACSVDNYNEYCEYLFSTKGASEELIHMIDVVTTNKTDFFREPAQFSFLSSLALNELVTKYGAGTQRPVKIWSAGCSTGEEPYTLAIVLQEFSEGFPRYEYKINATDISTRVLETAATAVYPSERIIPVPLSLKKKYFLKSKDPQKNSVRVVPELRKNIRFSRLNFMDSDFGVKEPYDIIFCRNVIIYFDKETQEKLIEKFLKLLVPGGFLFLGHSESIFKSGLAIEQVAPSTYKKL